MRHEKSDIFLDNDRNFLSDWLKKNSVFYNSFRASTTVLRPDAASSKFKSLPASAYQEFFSNYKALVESCRKHGVVPVLITQALAFNAKQPAEVQRSLHNGTLWGLGLEGAYDANKTLNDAIRAVAAEEKVALVDLALVIPGGADSFFDAIHFSPNGQRIVAKTLAARIGEIEVIASKLGGGRAF